jgi:hypothetical protein
MVQQFGMVLGKHREYAAAKALTALLLCTTTVLSDSKFLTVPKPAKVLSAHLFFFFFLLCPAFVVGEPLLE